MIFEIFITILRSKKFPFPLKNFNNYVIEILQIYHIHINFLICTYELDCTFLHFWTPRIRRYA